MSELISRLPDLVSQTLTALAQGLNTTVEYLVPIFIKQSYIEGVSSIIKVIFYSVIFAIGVVIIYKNLRKIDKNIEDSLMPLWFVLGVMLFVVGILNIIDFLSQLDIVITSLFNPEYKMIENILDKISTLTIK